MSNLILEAADQMMAANESPSSPEVIADTKAEESILACILRDPSTIVHVSAVLQPEHFYWTLHKSIYAAMLKLYEASTEIDFVTVMGEVENSHNLEGAAYASTRLMDMAFDTMFIPIENILAHARQVHDKYRLRMMLEAASKVAQDCYKRGANPDAVFAKLDDLFAPAAPLPVRDTSMTAALTKEMERFALLTQAREEGRTIGLYFGKNLDFLLRGMQPGNLLTVAARPGMGKTTSAINQMLWLAEKGNTCLFWSLEMSTSEITQKMIAYYSGIDSSRIRDCNIMEEEVPLYMEAVNHVAQLPIHIYSPADDEGVDDESGSSIDNFRSTARLLTQQHGVKVIFIDYLQLLEGKGDNRVQEISKITRSLKRFSVRYGLVIVALSQLNRNVESRADKTPNLSDLRESGSIEQDSDVVIFLYAEDYYDPETDQQGLVDFIFAKNRHGAKGTITMFFRRELSKFIDLEIHRTMLPEDIYESDGRKVTLRGGEDGEWVE